jgi:hypothetical protein
MAIAIIITVRGIRMALTLSMIDRSPDIVKAERSNARGTVSVLNFWTPSREKEVQR